ncbi:MAG: hypothetical protein IKC81_07595 [Paludibacteraceae bacterium]|nr:hypothetical protein [Paludibacteraceae bacterium]
MKQKIACMVVALLTTMGIYAQNQTFYDAITASSSELNGTARFVAVGGAMGALGGDASTVAYNPAGIGVYRSSELSITGNLHWTNTSMGGQQPSNYITANLANVSYIGTWLNPKAKGVITINFGITYNRLKNFSREGRYYNSAQPYSLSQFITQQTNGLDPMAFSQEVRDQFTDQNIGWRSILGYQAYLFNPIDGTNQYVSKFALEGGKPVSSNLQFSEHGSVSEYALSLGGNVANIFYWGMSVNCDYLYYQKRITQQETFNDGYSYTLANHYQMEGSGFTYKVGFIVKPVNWLRIGGAFHTPTWFYIKDWTSAEIGFKNNLDYKREETPRADGWLNLQSPLKALGSIGFVLGKFGFIGVDYEYSNYHCGMILRNGDNHLTPEMEEMNDAAKNALTDRHTVRIGMEFKPIEALSLRLGGGYSFPYTMTDASRPYYSNDVRCDTEYYNNQNAYNATCGIGYRIGRHAIDLAYVWQVNNATYYSFADADPISLRSVRNQVVLTYGIRF